MREAFAKLYWLVLSLKVVGMPTVWQDHPKHWDTVAVYIHGIAWWTAT